VLTELYSTTPNIHQILPLHVCTLGRFNNIAQAAQFTSGAAFQSSGWPANNRAIYTPMHMPASFTVARFMITNNNTTGNADIGLYNSGRTRLLSTGTVAKNGTAGTVQYFGVTDQRFPAGHYYLAMVVSTTSGAVFKANMDDEYTARMCGMLQEALGSTVLPTTMTPVAYSSNLIFLYGFTQSDSL